MSEILDHPGPLSDRADREVLQLGSSRPRILVRELIEMVREDASMHGGRWLAPGFQALAVHRFGKCIYAWPRVPRRLMIPVYQVLYMLVRTMHGIELPWRTSVGRRVRIVHQNGIVIHPRAIIGDNCIIRQNVTIGAATLERLSGAPRLGRDVEVGAGAVIIGDVTIGDGVRIGPNVVVMTSVPAGATVVAAASRIIQPPNPRAARGRKAAQPNTASRSSRPQT